MNRSERIFAASLALAAIATVAGCSKSDNAKSPGQPNSGAQTVSARPVGPVTLKVKWTAGKEYALRLEQSETVEFKVPDDPKPAKEVRKTTMDYSVSVLKELADGGCELEFKLTACKLDFTNGNRQTLNFDSRRDARPNPGDPVGTMFDKFIGEPVRLVLDTEGKVTRVEGVNELVGRVTGNGPPQIKGMFKQMFNEDSLKQLGTVAEGLPDYPVNVGDHWPVNLELPNAIGIIVIHLTDTFKEWESRGGRQCVRIAFKGDISSRPGPNSANASAKLENGDISGETWFDPALGMVVQSDDTEEMPLQIKNRGRMITGQIHRKASRTLRDVTGIGKT